MNIRSHETLKRATAWLLIAAMINPGPAIAQVVSNTPVRDTAIYLSTTASGAAEPNILIVLGTNDRMNIAEPWREYPGAYDSHVEYLWADPNLIRPSNMMTGVNVAIPDQVGELPGHPIAWGQSGGISLMAQPVNPTSPWGNWAGATITERQQLQAAALESTINGKALASDPGPRFLYRNYGGGRDVPSSGVLYPRVWTGDSNWIWWAPAGTPEESPLLWSASFNKFAGGTRMIGGIRGGMRFVDGNNNPSTDSWLNRNQCQASYPVLTPSTVFAPSTQPRNAGKFLNQSWMRWEPFLDLDNSMASVYPTTDQPAPWGGRVIEGSSGTGSIGSRITPRTGYANNNTAAPALTMESGPDFWPWWAGPNNLFPTQNPGNGDRGFASFGNGERWIFQHPGSYGAPIRMFVDNGTPGQVNPGDSRSGWSLPRADLGGYNFWWSGVGHLIEDAFSGFPGYAAQNPLREVLQQYGVAVSSTTPLSQVKFAALRGNRDAAGTDWWRVTGLPAYFSTSVTTGSITAGSNQLTIDRNNAFWIGQRINVPGAGVAGGNLLARVDNVTGADRRTLTLSAAAATAVTGATITVNLRLFDRDSSFCRQNCADSESATPASNNPVDAWGSFRSFRSTASTCIPGSVDEGAPGVCAATGTPACGAPGSNDVYRTVQPSGCFWTGRSSVFVEGVGNVFHGGTCAANCTSRFPHLSDCAAGPTSTTYCGAPTAANRTFNGVTYANATIGNGANGQGDGCGAVNVAGRQLNCLTREGLPCQYGRGCGPAVRWDTPPSTDFAVVNRARFAGYLVHDCQADNGTAANFNGFISARTDRTFGAEWNSTVSNAANTAAAYAPTDPGSAVPAIDTYSANYLNWKFGPRGPNGHPIGRATRLTTAKSAISDLVTSTNGVRFGLMVTNRTRTDLTNDGGNIAYAMRRMGTDSTDPDFANRATLVTAINNVVASSRTPLTETLYEAMLYFSGRTPQWGTDTSTAFIGGTASQGRDATAVCTAISADCPSVGVYRSPMLSNPTVAAPASCQKNFVVMITNGIPEDDWSANTLPGSRGVRNLAHNSTSPNPVGTFAPVQGVDSFNTATTSQQFENPVTNQPYGLLDQGSTAFDGGYLWLDELAYFMRNADMSPGARIFPGDSSTDALTGTQGIITYTIGFRGASSPVVQQAAVRGDGLYYEAQDAQDLRNLLQQAITSITSFTGTLAAATVPISAYNRAQTALEVYMAFFEPSTNVSWRGTVRKYGIGVTSGECGNNALGNPITFCLIGQTTLPSGNRNIEVSEQIGTTGVFERLISTLAVSYWNPVTEVDGRDPARGGTGFQLKSSAPTIVPGTTNGTGTRNVYTKLSTVAATDLTNPSNAVSGGNANITNAMMGLGAADTAGRYRLLNWIRGGNMTVPQCNGVSSWLPCDQWSAWPHADVLHSKPTLVYYNTTTAPPQQTLFYLSNTGLLHAVDANTGRERWAFMVEEALPQLGQMLANGNGQQIQVADGAPAVHVDDINGNGIVEAGDRVIITFGLRRGGRSMYAIDVTSLSAPAFLWKITADGGGQLCTGSCSSQPLYAELGQSWSTPVVGRVAGVPNPVVMFGGGYDPNQDNEPVSVADTMGRAFYVVDLVTGIPIRRFDSSNVLVNGSPAGAMTNSVPSEPTALDTNGDGLIDRVYIGDTAANVFRFQISDINPLNWAGKLLARLSTGAVPNRKILFPFAVVPQSAGGSRFDAIYLGTGDREHPFKLSSADIIAMLIDRDFGPVMSVSPPTLFTDTDFVKLAHDDLTGSAPPGGTSKGWARLLPPTAKVTEAPTVFQNMVLAPIYGSASSMGFPALVSSCIPSFTSRIYGYAGLDGSITLLPGNSTNQAFIDGVWSRNFVPSGQLILLPDGRVGFLFTNPTATFVQVAVVGVPQRVYWYLEPGI
ncbi:MAG: hypothetical protein K2W80_18255 [Burkholderiales bacterium]|nr:hypothetical protein [Burkholderiales bacterium]